MAYPIYISAGQYKPIEGPIEHTHRMRIDRKGERIYLHVRRQCEIDKFFIWLQKKDSQPIQIGDLAVYGAKTGVEVIDIIDIAQLYCSHAGHNDPYFTWRDERIEEEAA